MRRLFLALLLALLPAAAMADRTISGPVTFSGEFGGTGSRVEPCGIRAIRSGATDTALATDCVVLWDSGTSSNKTQNLLSCNSALLVTVSDERQTATSFPITIVPNGSDTVYGASSLVLTQNGSSVDLVCDSTTHNWVIR